MYNLFILNGDDLSDSILIAQSNDLKVLEAMFKPMLEMELYKDFDFIVKHKGMLILIDKND